MLRFGVMLPTCTAMLLVTYTKLYSRWLDFTAPAVAMLQSLCLVVSDLLMYRQGYSLSSVLPMLVLSAYMLFGMMQMPGHGDRDRHRRRLRIDRLVRRPEQRTTPVRCGHEHASRWCSASSFITASRARSA